MKIKCFIVTAVLMLSMGLNSCAPSDIVVVDANGNPVDSVSYKLFAINEAKELLSEIRSIDITENQLKDFQIKTYFNKDVFDAIKGAATQQNYEGTDIGCAATDLDGHLIASYSSNEKIDYSNKKTMPYSSFKPLSVYSPAIEDGVINWSSMYEDSPYGTVVTKDGTLQEWPTNSDLVYLNIPVSIQRAVAKSLNTVAVRVMDDYGIDNSLKFLDEKFGIDVTYESNKAQNEGDGEVLGNVALGHIQNGVTAVDMAGYYQTFAKDGYYAKPSAVMQITDKDGTVVYTHKTDAKQVISSKTAYIMNNLLQTVVSSKEGTAREAAVQNVKVAGKTGTGELGNWFVGITPQYSLAVWHGKQQPQNNADVLFGQIMSQISHDKNADFPACKDVIKRAYCMDNGLIAKKECSLQNVGYYALSQPVAVCNKNK